jgi:AcrR family transcriptional regulator
VEERERAPRGRHAPPLEVRQDRQRHRLFAAAAAIFSRMGYADATAEAIAREAGMSKATFYEHFDNKEDCILALFDAASEAVLGAMREASSSHPDDPVARYRAAITAFLHALAAFPDQAQTLLVEIIGAGPRAMERRDTVLAAFADYIESTNEEDVADGGLPRLASSEDAFAIVGAVVELASRQLRTGRPSHLLELEPVVERLVSGLLEAASPRAAA